MNNIRTLLAEQFQTMPGFAVGDSPNGRDNLSLQVGGRTISLCVVGRNAGYPRDVRNAVWQARESLGPREDILIFAPSLAPGSREWLRGEGISYTDGAGHLFIHADGVYILRDEMVRRKKEPAASARQRETNIYRGKATQVLHALLHAPDRDWHVTELAVEAGVASGTALRVCAFLEKMLFIERAGRGPQSLRRVIEPGRLLDAWADEHQLTDYAIDRYSGTRAADPNALALHAGNSLESRGYRYAVTLSLGAVHGSLQVAQTGQAALLVHPDADLSQLASDTQLKAVEEGGSVLLLRARNESPLMYPRREDGLWIASDIQIYLDLHASPARRREEADRLWRERLGF